VIDVERTWGEVGEGTTIASPTGEPLAILQIAPDSAGRLWYLATDRGGHRIKIKPKPSDAIVTVLEATEAEAISFAKAGLRAEQILDVERERRMSDRAKQWIVPVFPRKGEYDALTKARDHLQWYHGTYAGDAKNGGFRTLAAITAAHQEMHEQVFMDLPHTHTGD